MSSVPLTYIIGKSDEIVGANNVDIYNFFHTFNNWYKYQSIYYL